MKKTINKTSDPDEGTKMKGFEEDL